MNASLSRIMSAATATYAVYALVRPRHLGAAISDDEAQQDTYDVVARVLGCRDLVISAAGVLSKDERVVRAAMAVRVAMDLGDAALLGPRAATSERQQRILAVTTGWAAMNALALEIDRRRGRH